MTEHLKHSPESIPEQELSLNDTFVEQAEKAYKDSKELPKKVARKLKSFIAKIKASLAQIKDKGSDAIDQTLDEATSNYFELMNRLSLTPEMQESALDFFSQAFDDYSKSVRAEQFQTSLNMISASAQARGKDEGFDSLHADMNIGPMKVAGNLQAAEEGQDLAQNPHEVRLSYQALPNLNISLGEYQDQEGKQGAFFETSYKKEFKTGRVGLNAQMKDETLKTSIKFEGRYGLEAKVDLSVPMQGGAKSYKGQLDKGIQIGPLSLKPGVSYDPNTEEVVAKTGLEWLQKRLEA